MLVGGGDLVHRHAGEDILHVVGRIEGAVMVQAEGDAVLGNVVRRHDQVLGDVLAFKGGQEVQVIGIEPGVGNLDGGVHDILGNCRHGHDGHDLGVPEPVYVDVDVLGVRRRMGRIFDEHPAVGGHIEFAVVADDGHFHAVVGGEDAGLDVAGFKAGVGDGILFGASGDKKENGR